MVKKTTKKVAQKKAVNVEKKVIKEEKENDVKFKFPKFLQNVEFNLYIMIYLLSIVVLLISGVLFYTSELLKATNQEIVSLNEELAFADNYVDYRIMKFTFSEFSEVTEFEVKSILNLKKYAEAEKYDEIILEGFELYASKIGDCFEDTLRKIDVCEIVELNYDARDQDVISVLSAIEVAE